MTPVMVLTTVGASFDPRALATELVDKRLAACVNVIPKMHSVYRWQGKIEEEDEQLLLIKTAEQLLDDVKQALFAGHPYEIPEFIVLRLDDLSEAYREWLLSSL